MQKKSYLITMERNRRATVRDVCESSLKTFRSNGKLKGHHGGMVDYEQSIMNRKECSSRSSEKSGVVVDLCSSKSLASQLWVEVSPIIHQVNAKIKLFFGLFGATECKISPFCKSFKNETKLCEAFESFMPKHAVASESQDGDDSENEEEEIATSELPTLGQVKNLIKKVTDGDQSNVKGTEIAIE